jgi:hypothetical protein
MLDLVCVSERESALGKLSTWGAAFVWAKLYR